MVTAAIKKLSVLTAALFIIITCSSIKHDIGGNKKTGTLKISFINTVKSSPLVLDSTEYSNPFGETYHVSRLKYYISNIVVNNVQHSFNETDSYHLIDANDTASLNFSFETPVNNYNSISFIIGVDSIKNVSGAQSGALDPMHGMFWTWNSGYIFFKLEGQSAASTIFNKRIEYHIGGFAGMNNALQSVTLPLQLQVHEGKTSAIIIAADIDKIWQGAGDLQIATTPATMTPGVLSKKIADNYSNMFTVKEVLNH